MEKKKKSTKVGSFIGNIKENLSRPTVIVTIIVLIVLIAVVICCICLKQSQNGKLNYNEETGIYTINAIEVKNNGGLTYNVNTHKYVLPLIVVNNKSNEYSKVTFTMEFYDSEGNTLMEVTKSIDNLQANEEKEISLDCGESQLLVYDYRITDIKLEK